MTRNLALLLDSLRSGENPTQSSFYERHPDCRVAATLSDLKTKFGVSKTTFYVWLKEYITTGQFKTDKRGLWAERFLEHNEDLKTQMQDWIMQQKEIDVDLTWDYINDTLLKDFPVGRLCGSSGLQRPVCRTTALAWMKLCGAEFKTRLRGYYNDTHERWDNQLYRSWWCLAVQFIELRQPR